jgi:AmmeMemoRadiSam system protein B
MIMPTKSIRKAAMAGTFYPEDGAELHHALQRYLKDGHGAGSPPKAIIAPHAGYIYSGPVAGSAFKAWTDIRGKVDCVVLVGPSHRVVFKGIALPDADFFATPLGLLPVDKDACEKLRSLPFVRIYNAAHIHEHSVETHLPFIQETLGETPIVPLVVGDADPREVAQLIDTFWERPGVVFSISSDLSHYLTYDEARRVDADTTAAIEHNQCNRIGPDRACGWLPILGLLHVIKRRGKHARALDVRNSGDTAGDRYRVVGYGAYAVE